MKFLVVLDRRKDKFFEEGDEPFSILGFDSCEHMIMITDISKSTKKEINAIKSDEALVIIPDHYTQEDRKALKDYWEGVDEGTDLDFLLKEE